MYYKITTPSNYSFYAYSTLAVLYTLGEWVVPNLSGSKLFVFDTIESVKLFLEKSKIPHLVYECEVQNPFYPKVPIATLTHDFYQYWIDYEELVSKKTAPKGSIMCSACKITGIVNL